MKRSTIVLLCCFALVLTGCGTILSRVEKHDKELAQYYEVEAFDINCKAGIVKCDMDVSADPVSIRRSEAVLQYADVQSANYKACYAKTAWLYWTGSKIEGAIRTWLKRLTELGVLVP